MVEGQRFTFTREERITGKKRIDDLFAHGQSFIAYPFRIVFRVYECVASVPVSVLISMPKKKLKKATERNRMKRLVREAYRLNKVTLQGNFSRKNCRIDIAFIYVKDEPVAYDMVEKSVCRALREISDKLKSE